MNKKMDQEIVVASVGKFADLVQGVIDENWSSHGYTFSGAPEVSVNYGRRYAKLVTDQGVFCFVDLTNGDVLKAASFRAPAKHARGNIFDADGGRSAVNAYGANYL